MDVSAEAARDTFAPLDLDAEESDEKWVLAEWKKTDPGVIS